MNSLMRKYLQGDMVIWAVVFLLSLISVLAVYSATNNLAHIEKAGNTEFYLFKHFLIIALGWGIIYFVHKIPYNYFSRIAQIFLWISIPLLAVTLVAGTSVNSASRWLTLPVINITFQTSDLAKLALIAYLARILSKRQDVLDDFNEGFLQIVWPVLVICALILPANFSTSAVLFVTSLILMFIGRVQMKFLAGLVGTIIISGAFVFLLSYALPIEKVLPRFGTWKARVETFFSNEETQEMADANYQTEQAKIAIATGGITGVGPGNSVQRNRLPSAYADFIYAIIIEEWGFIGGMSILFLYLILLFRGLRIVHKGTTVFGTLLAFGCTFSLIFQAFINMAVAVNLFPVTGQPLPLLSMGGTSIWFTSISIGMILSVSRALNEKEAPASSSEPEYEPITELAHG
ncbi:MAG: cell division protein FtsW [Bacteroidetes bacterium]|nr:MAG: cell division protein FtsW [Bacteroidota bacterium]